MRDSRMAIGIASAATLVAAALLAGASKQPSPATHAMASPRPAKALVQSAAASAESAEVATTPDTRATGVARGGATPKLQPPVLSLTFERFRNAFNADAGEPRLLLLLSPT